MNKPEGVGIRGAGSAQPEPPKGKLRGEVRPGGPFMREHRRAEAEMAAQMAQPEPTLAGWKFEKASHHQAFETYLVQAPNGYTAVVSALDRNPANVLFLLAKTMVRALAAITPPDPLDAPDPKLAAFDKFAAGWRYDAAKGEVTHVHQTERSVESPEAAIQDRADAERWRWFAGDCDGDAQDDLIRLLSGTILSKAEIDECVDAAMKERP